MLRCLLRIVLLLVLLVCVPSARAATFLVTNVADTNDGACDAACTLREAINAANGAVGDDAIVFDTTVFGTAQTITLGGTLLPAIMDNLTITGSTSGVTISGNNTSGVFSISGGTVTIDKLTIANGNRSMGGGVYNSGGTLTLTNSTLSGNKATNGGAIYNNSANIMTMINCTLSGNVASGDGGGIFNDGTTSLNNCTLSGNAASNGGGIFNNNTLRLFNTIVAVNNATTGGPDIQAVVSVGSNSRYNLIGVDSGLSGITNGVDGNQIGTSVAPIDPKLSVLTNNGGPTQTMALQISSTAVNRGDFNYSNTLTSTDQRGSGFPRINVNRVDIGAFELNFVPIESTVVNIVENENNGTSDVRIGAGTSLYEAMKYANTNSGSDIITFDPVVFGTHQTIGAGYFGFPTISDSVTITGPPAGVTLDAGYSRNVLNIANYSFLTVKLENLTVTRSNNGGIRTNSGNLTIINCIIFDNLGNDQAAGIVNGYVTPSGAQPGGTVNLVNCTISGNRGVGLAGGILNTGTLTATNCSISGNTTSNSNGLAGQGGGICNRGTFTLNNCTVSGNTAQGDGGGIFSYTNLTGVTTTLNNCTISGNSSATRGGGIFNNHGLTVIENSTITNNTASSNSGGGLGLFGDTDSSGDSGIRTEVSNSIVAGNTSSDVDLVGQTINNYQSNGYNLIGTGNASGAFNNTGDQTGITDPKLSTLANNGGPTQTIALLSSSPAINAGDPAFTAPPDFDQRGTGFPRVQGARLDIGAFEATKLLINDISITEGNSGTTNAVFTATLTSPVALTVTVAYAATKGTGNPALVSSDFVSTKGTLTFAPGETTKTISVPIIGDYVLETDENFFVRLSNPVNATMSDAQGVGTIINDDFDTTPPSVSFTTSATTPIGTTPVHGSTIYNAMPAITGVAADSGSGVARVTLRLYRATATAGIYEYWNGTSWVVPGGAVAIPNLPTTLSAPAGSLSVSWNRSSGWPGGTALADGTYYLSATAADRAGKVAVASQNFKKATANTLSTNSGVVVSTKQREGFGQQFGQQHSA